MRRVQAALEDAGSGARLSGGAVNHEIAGEM
jgi:hypothetical protein